MNLLPPPCFNFNEKEDDDDFSSSIEEEDDFSSSTEEDEKKTTKSKKNNNCSKKKKKPLRVHLKEDDYSQPCIFSFSVTSGNSLRHFAEFAKRVAKEIPMIITDRGISIALCSQSRQIVCHVAIRKEDLTEFHVDDNLKTSGESESFKWKHCLNVDSYELIQALRTVSKKESVKIRQLEENGPIYVDTISGISTIVKTSIFSPPKFDIIEEEKVPSTEPTVTVSISRFTSELNSLFKSRLGKIKLHLFENILTIVGYSQTNVSKRIVNISTNPQPILSPLNLEDSISTVSLLPTTFSALSKISGISSEGVIKFYKSLTTTQRIRIELPISCFGILRIYIIESNLVKKI